MHVGGALSSRLHGSAFAGVARGLQAHAVGGVRRRASEVGAGRWRASGAFDWPALTAAGLLSVSLVAVALLNGGAARGASRRGPPRRGPPEPLGHAASGWVGLGPLALSRAVGGGRRRRGREVGASLPRGVGPRADRRSRPAGRGGSASTTKPLPRALRPVSSRGRPRVYRALAGRRGPLVTACKVTRSPVR